MHNSANSRNEKGSPYNRELEVPPDRSDSNTVNVPTEDIRKKIEAVNIPLQENRQKDSATEKVPKIVLRDVLEDIKRNREIYVFTRFLLGETPHNFEEFQTTANKNAFDKYDARTGIGHKGSDMIQEPMHFSTGTSNIRTTIGAEQIIGLQPHFDGKQWIVYYNVGGKHGVEDTRSGIPLVIAVSCPNREDAESLLSIFERDPTQIRPFFIEAGKEAQGSGVQKVLQEGSSRAPKYGFMQNAFLVLRSDEEHFDSRYIDQFGKDIDMNPKLLEYIDGGQKDAQWRQRKRLAREQEREAVKETTRKTWWKFWQG